MMSLASIGSVPPQGDQALNVPWLTLLVVLAGIAVLMLIIRGLGFFLAKRHPVPTAKPAASIPPPSPVKRAPGYDLDPQTVAVIAAVISTVIPQPFGTLRIAPMPEKQDYSVEDLMQIWSMEGRRQIYDSHRIR
jgi:hypothetical protein